MDAKTDDGKIWGLLFLFQGFTTAQGLICSRSSIPYLYSFRTRRMVHILIPFVDNDAAFMHLQSIVEARILVH